MKKQLLKSVLIAVAGVGLMAGSAMALPSDQGTVTVLSGVYGTTTGGEYILDFEGSTANYIGFCLEKSEHVYPPHTYSYSLSDTVYGGGNNVPANDPNGDELDGRTEWLMLTYVNNISALYGIYGTSNSNDLADFVQKTIWQLEEEDYFGYENYIGQLSYISPELDQRVTAVNIFDETGNIQSMIIADPVPEPATMLLFGSGIVALAGLARRKKD